MRGREPSLSPSSGQIEARLTYWQQRRDELQAMLAGRLPQRHDKRHVRRALGWVEDAIQRIEVRR